MQEIINTWSEFESLVNTLINEHLIMIFIILIMVSIPLFMIMMALMMKDNARLD